MTGFGTARLDELVAFCRKNGNGKCFKGWDWDDVALYARFHICQGTMVYAMDGGDVAGVAFGWQCNEADTQRSNFTMEPFWGQATNPQGDSFYFAECVCVRPCMKRLVESFEWRWPYWRRLKLFAIRDGKVRHYGNGERLIQLLKGH